MAVAFPEDPARSGFVFGGRRSLYSPMDQTALRHDRSGNDWLEIAPMPSRRGIGRAVCLTDLIYVLGGCVDFGTGLDVVEAYDPSADAWLPAPSMPEPLHDFAAVSWRDSIILVLGGGNWAPTSPPTSSVWLFDRTAGNWYPATPLPERLGAATAAVIDNDIYLATGWTDSGPTNRVWRGALDPAQPTMIHWQEMDTLPAARRCRALGTAIAKRLQVIGGITAEGTVSDEVWELDPVSQTWRSLHSKPTPISDVYGTCNFEDLLLVPGGYAGTLPYRDEAEAKYTGNFNRDVALRSVVSPRGRVAPIATQAAVEVVNYGATEEVFPVSMRIVDTITGQLVFTAESVVTLPVGGTAVVPMNEFLPDPNRVYSVKAWTGLDPDENRANDTSRTRTRTTTGSDPDGFGYIYESSQEPDTIRFSWRDPSGGDTLSGWFPDPDDGYLTRLLPFEFPFYGSSVSRVSVSVDGLISMTGTVAPHHQTLPSFDLDGLIAPFWLDLTLRTSGAVIEHLLPNSYCITWSNVPRYGAPADILSFQAMMERNGNIRFNYLRTEGTTNSTIGIQGGDGGDRRFLEYWHDGEPTRHRPADSVSVVFRPPATGPAIVDSPVQSDLPAPMPTLLSVSRLPLSAAINEPLRMSIHDAVGRRRACRMINRGSTYVELVDDAGGTLPPGAYFLTLSRIPSATPLHRSAGTRRHKLVILAR